MSDAAGILARAAWRSLWRNRRRTFITLVSIGVGLMLVIFMVALAEGVYYRLVEDAVRLQCGHVTVMHPRYQEAPSADLFVRGTAALRARLAGMPGIERTKALILGQGLVKTAAGAVGVAVMGVEPAVEKGTSPLARKIRKGRYLRGNDGAEIVIGAALAERLRLEVGKKLVLAVNDVNGEMVEELCRVRGIFRMDTDEMDGYLVQVPIGFARRIFGMPRDSATQVGAVLSNPGDRSRLAVSVAALPEAAGSGAYPWEKVLPEVAAYIKLDRSTNWIMQGLLIFLVLFTIFNTMLMSVLERSREFGVLLALGTSPVRLRAQVLMEALFVDALGCMAGLVLGSGFTWYYIVKGIDFSSMAKNELSIGGFGYEKMLYPALTPEILAWTGGAVFLVTLLLSLFPVWKSARVRVAEVLR